MSRRVRDDDNDDENLAQDEDDEQAHVDADARARKLVGWFSTDWERKPEIICPQCDMDGYIVTKIRHSSLIATIWFPGSAWAMRQIAVLKNFKFLFTYLLFHFEPEALVLMLHYFN